ncbi:uncharacterized protein LOC110858010 isoform X2 [Folsomia candida]|uniref:uncharacterized protein LOC110858010 isoform X2 n=1 Tax=Folsomia candida TaxID=158441 RepID=UPI0016055A03|nr:uncharacterized protein LOC110858010 isoform X2 [Folsomia candida]
MRNHLTSSALFSALVLVCHCLAKEKHTVGRSLGRSQVGTLYDLRSKLARSAPSSSSSYPSYPSSPSSASAAAAKEARGYSFHYNPSDISHPAFSSSYASQDFHSRMGKISDQQQQQHMPAKKKQAETKNWDKYSKYAYKTSNSNGEEIPMVNSFTIFHNETTELGVVGSSTTSTTQASTTTTTSTTNKASSSGSTNNKAVTSSPPGKTASSGGFDLSKIASIGLGINDAMTSVLTQKLMTMIDQDFPQGILKPLKHLVSSGNRMVEFWDKRANARDGKPPGIVEMLGYGIEQLKKYRDGLSMKASDPIVNITSPSKTLIQGMVTVKKLTNRVLGYDTEEAAVESRGGYGHDSYGGGGYGHHVSYGHYLDPYAILATLGFGVFLFNVIFNLLNNNAAASGRSLDVQDIDLPLELSDISKFSVKDKIFGTPTTRTRRSVDDDEENAVFNSIIDKLDGMYKTYRVVSNKPSCARLYLCRLAVQDADADETTYSSKFYMYGLKHLVGDTSANDFVRSIQSRVAKGEEVDCYKEVSEACNPSDEE